MNETKGTGTAPRRPSGIGEFFRKLMVGLKRKPQTIPLLVLVVAFLYYSLNLTNISDTTARIQGQGMGLCGFATMLFSILSFVCFLNAFPHRKRANIPMLILMFLMLGLIIFCDDYYIGLIATAVMRPDNPIRLEASTIYIAIAYNILNDHIIILCVAIGLIVLLPLYRMLLRKINTSVTVEEYGKMDAIDISGED